jgi:AFG3 family protein
MSTTENSNPKEEKKTTKGPQMPGLYFYIFIVIFMVVLANFFKNKSKSGKEITWGKFEKAVMAGDIEKVVVLNKEDAEVFLKKDKLKKPDYKEVEANTQGPHYFFTIGSVDVFEGKLDKLQQNIPPEGKVNVEYVTVKNWMGDILLWILPFALLFLLWSWMGKRMTGTGSSLFSFGQSNAVLLDKENRSTITFEDAAGLDEAKEEVKEVVDFLKNSQSYIRLGAKIPKGILLIGPPGTGKTLLAKAVAGEAQVPFFSLSGSQFVEMFVGVGASRVRDLFRQAKAKAPCIIFIDEVDAIGRSRGKVQSMGGNDERENTLNQLLTEMDGFGTNSGVIVLAATNRGDTLDWALLRPGRFDRHIYLELPDLRERKEIFNVHLKPLKIDDSVNVEMLAEHTAGFSGADIANACNEAALIAARRRKNRVGQEEFTEALDRIIGGLEKRQKIVSPKEKTIVAFHEAGHALATCYLKGLKEVVKVSIIPRGKSLGAAWYRPEEIQLITYSQLFNEICIVLAGRAAEEVSFGEISSGALDDLEKVTKRAYTMIAFYGLSEKVGNVSFYDSTGNYENSFQKPYSEETARIIDEEVRKLIERAYQKVKDLLNEHKDELTKIGELLLEKEVIYRNDLEYIVNSKVKADGRK